MDLSGRPKRALAGLSICALGVGLITVPVLDMYEDITVGGKPIYSTMIENSIGLLLALLLVAGGFWVASRDWQFRYVRRMIVWTWGIAAGFGFVFTWILGIQVGLQGEYKPIVIALDAILLGSVVAFGVGIFDVRREQGKQRADREQSRTAALFENTADDVATLRVSPERVVSLSTNAVEHNDADEPLVRVTAETTTDSVVVRIADNGPGIPEGMRSRVLEKGEKGEESEGTGLGLYLCEEIISTYGGELRVNESELGGAEFELELPRADGGE